jgi:ribosomal protein L1
MSHVSKRMRSIKEKLPAGKVYSVKEALALLKDLPLAKFRESVDLCVNLGVDPRNQKVPAKKLKLLYLPLVPMPKLRSKQVRISLVWKIWQIE